MITFYINDREVTVPDGTTILEAAREIGVYIPTLCHLDLHAMEMSNQNASCRVCMVEQEGRDKMLTSCSVAAWDGLRVRTDTPKVIRTRKMMIELLLSDHPTDCLICFKNGNCELQTLAADNHIRKIHYPGAHNECTIDDSSLSIVRDMNKCVLCKRCETVCNDIQTVGALTTVGRGFETVVGTLFDLPMMDTTCTFCGQCVSVCPTGALRGVNNNAKVWDALADPTKTVVVQTAPAVRVALGEAFGLPAGTDVTGKMVAALRSLGFDYVYDTNFAADVTIVEEANEFVHRFKDGGVMPILTSCCPSWVKFIEHNFGDMLDIPSSCKSPHEMFGSLAKTYLAQRLGKNPDDIVVVSIMPCLAKKYESARPELTNEGRSDVDIVVSTRELSYMIKETSQNFSDLVDSDFDDFMGESSGAGTIFGSAGGVLEATLRTAYEILTGDVLEKVDFTELRGLEGIKEAAININGTVINVASASGLGNARALLERVRSGEKQYHAIEIMACPGGCIDGGGQPFIHGDTDILKKRMGAIYEIDREKPVRQSHKNPSVIKLYDDFLGEPYGEKAKELLHTAFTLRKKS